MRDLTFTYENVDKYYQKKFMFDMCNYFVIKGWDYIPRGTFPDVTEQNIIRKLYKWKSRACLTPEGKAMLTPENFFILTPLKS